MAGDAAFLLAPAGLGLLAQLTDCTTALWSVAAVVTAANATFALRTTEADQTPGGSSKLSKGGEGRGTEGKGGER